MSGYNYGQMLIGAPHIRGAISVQRLMIDVMLALLPGIFVWLLLFGFASIASLIVAVIAALLSEAICLHLRGMPLATLKDCSAVVSALLLALCLSPLAPLWVVAGSAAFAIIIGKHAFGGLGRNIFNPAMLGFAFAIICFPQHLAKWFLAGSADATSAATPLVSISDGLNQMRMVNEIFIGIGDNLNLYIWLAIAWLVGGIYLIARRVIDWKVPACMLLCMFVVAGFFWMYDENRYMAPWWHCVLGGSMLGAFFIITDPVSTPVVLRARLVFACGVAILTWWIRNFAALADGVAFAVLLMNIVAPLLDRVLCPKVMGTMGTDGK